MAKKAYIGVDGVARKVKKGYLGILTDIPIYEEQTATVNITADNISDFFDVTNGTYYFSGGGDTFTSNNNGVNSSTATTTLTAKMDMTVSFQYSYSSEANYDKFTLKVAGTTVENAVSGATTSKSYSGSLTAGQTIEFTYAKDSSQSSNDDKCTFSAMSVTAVIKTQTGIETNDVARKVKSGYVGVSGVARQFLSSAEDEIDALFSGMEIVDAYGVNQSSTSQAYLAAVSGAHYLAAFADVSQSNFSLIQYNGESGAVPPIWNPQPSIYCGGYYKSGELYASKSQSNYSSHRGCTIAQVSFETPPVDILSNLEFAESGYNATSSGGEIKIDASALTGVNYIFVFVAGFVSIAKYKDGALTILKTNSIGMYTPILVGDYIGARHVSVETVFATATRGSIYAMTMKT